MPDYIYSDKRLTDVSRRVYAFIHTYKNPFYFGNEHLAEMFKVHAETISTAIGQLETLKLIKTDYKVKAGGGKIRLCLDAYSEQASTLSRDKKSEPTNKRLHLDNDIKDNNIKGKNLVDEDNFKDKAWKEAQRLRKEKKQESHKLYHSYKPAAKPSRNYPEKPDKPGAHGEHII